MTDRTTTAGAVEGLAMANRWMSALPRDQFGMFLLLVDGECQRAIRQTTESAACFVETFCKWQGSNNLADAHTKEWLSEALRNNEHMKGPQP